MASLRLSAILALTGALLYAQLPKPVQGGYELPNGWRITPLGKAIPTEDLILNLALSPDSKTLVATHGGFNPHGLVVLDPATETVRQRIPLRSAWLGLAWSPDGKRLYASGGNSVSRRDPATAAIYVFDAAEGKLSEKPSAEWRDSAPANKTYWTGLAHHPKKGLLYAANRGNDPAAGYVAVFDTASGRVIHKIAAGISPYDLVLSPDGSRLYVSNWSSDYISIIDTASNKVTGRLTAGDNPNDMALAADGRLFVSNGNLNTVSVFDTAKRVLLETINVALTPNAPPGSTPNALALDEQAKILFVANADNNSIAVVGVKEMGRSEVLGFFPSGWYPSALALLPGSRIAVGNSKGLGGYSNERGPHSPLAADNNNTGRGSVKSLQKGSINFVALKNLKADLPGWTKQVISNVPYADSQLQTARAAKSPSIVPSAVGAGSPIKHIIYVIKENRTYDQVFGDLPQGNGDPRITIFGRQITPNHHAIAEQWVLLDNLYCDGEVSVDGHAWSNSAIATDYNEKNWPPQYGGHSIRPAAYATIPSSGQLWDVAAKAGLTYRSYGEYAARASDGTTMEAAQGVAGLIGRVAPRFKLPGMRDTDNVREFIREFDEFEKNYDDPDPAKRLPNYVVMSLPENHTAGTRPGAFTPRAMVANNDHAVGMLVERVTHSKYWKETAIFIIEDDAQDGSDHVDARRTIGMVVSPYTKRGKVDSTLYTTSSYLRTMELLLGLPPMTQYDAAATPMYESFGTAADLRPYSALPPQWDVNEKNKPTDFGAQASLEMNLDEIDEAPMREFNEIIWKSVKGANSEMPAPVHRLLFARDGK